MRERLSDSTCAEIADALRGGIVSGVATVRRTYYHHRDPIFELEIRFEDGRRLIVSPDENDDPMPPLEIIVEKP